MTGFSFANIEVASADASTTGTCVGNDSYFIWGLTNKSAKVYKEGVTKSACYKLCSSVSYCDWSDSNSWTGSVFSTHLKQPGEVLNYDYGSDVCAEVTVSSPVSDWLNCILVYVLKFIGFLLTAVTILFTKIIDVSVFKTVVSDNSVIYEMWGFVRDMLNVAFILVLLFSAFCTVFQITKYSYKNILLSLILMALLVNFSFPIARVIIDFSNVIMYWLINGFGFTSSDNNLFVEFSSNAEIRSIIDIQPAGANTAYLLAAIVFLFIFTVTLAVIAVLLLIRIVVLAVLIIFASIAFVGSIVPFLSSYSGKWWDSLFKQSFFGPIMIFMLVVSARMLKSISDLKTGFGSVASAQTGQNPSIIAAMAFFAIPIVILWVGLSVAQTMSVVGASAVVGRGQKFMGWAGRNLTGYRAAKWGTKVGAKKFERDVLAPHGLSPRAFIKAWQEQAVATEEEKMRPATGAWRDRLNRSIFFGKRKTNYGQLDLDRLSAKEEKEIKEMSEDSGYVNSRLADVVGVDNNKARAAMKAAFRMHFGQNDQDELMDFIRNNLHTKGLLANGKTFAELGFEHEVEMVQDLDADGNVQRDKDGNIKMKEVVKKSNTTVSAENVVNAVQLLMKESNATNKEIEQTLINLSQIAAAKGGIGYGAIAWDNEQKKFRITDYEKGELAAANAAKILTTGEAQNIPKTLHRNHFTDQHGNLNMTGKELLFRYASPTAIKHIERHKPDFYKRVGADAAVAKQMYEFAGELRDNKAMLWDSNAKKKIAKGDKAQALQAVAWVAALQSKSGVSIEDIEKNVTAHGFDWKEVESIAKAAGSEIKAPSRGNEGESPIINPATNRPFA